MHTKEGKYVRFEDLRSEQSAETERFFSSANQGILGLISDNIKRGGECLGSCFWYGAREKSQLNNGTKIRSEVLDPQGPTVQKWNKIFVLSCVIAIAVDPLFFYIPVINSDSVCLDLDRNLEITASILRVFTDIFYILHIISQFRTGFVAPSSVVSGRGVLVVDRRAIAKRYLSTYFLIDVLAVLPLPQVVILIVLPNLQGKAIVDAKNILMFVVIFQYVPRLIRILPLYRQITRSAGVITETAWAGAAFNLLLYMLASHVVGALWYLLSIQRANTCWRDACSHINCDSTALYCGQHKNQNNSFLVDACSVSAANASLYFGIYLQSLQNVAQSRKFFEKFFYCFWWGLQNLSSLGQNMKTSTYTWENMFAVFISVFSLVLFALLIGNMQTYLQSTSIRIEEMRVKSQDEEQWMTHRLLPENMKERIRRYEQYRWQETRGVDEESMLLNLPKDLRRDIKHHLCLKLLMRVPMFEKMDDQLLDAMCNCLKPVLYTKSSCIIRELDPVNEMLFIMRGDLESATTNGGRTGFFNSNILKPGDFCGEELLTWALDPRSSSNLPISTRTVKTISEVEAFSLRADDLNFVATQYRKLHSKQLQHTFRFYSQQWRTWAACFIQAAWRRYCRKKLEESLYEKEQKLQAAIVSDSSNPLSLGAALYASRFAGNMLRILRRNAAARLEERLPMKLLQKPPEPNFEE